MQPDFHTLRTMLNDTRCKPEQWERLRQMLTAFGAQGESEQQAAIDYVAGHLEHWPDKHRRLPMWSCWPTFPHGPPGPLWKLVRSLPLVGLGNTIANAETIEYGNALQQLRHVSLSMMVDPDPDIMHNLSILESGSLTQVKEFALDWSIFPIEWLIAIGERESMPALEGLLLHPFHDMKNIGPDVLLLPQFHNLRSIDLQKINWDRQQCITFIEGHEWSKLETLQLHDGTIDHKAAEALVHSPLPSQLTTLKLDRCELSKKSLQTLASVSWPKLETLLLDNNPLDGAIARFLAKAELPSLRELSIAGCGWTNRGLSILSQQTHVLSQLKRLNISHTDDKVSDWKTLLSQPALSALEHLELESCELDEERCKDIAEHAHLPSLQTLSLSDSGIDDEGFEHISQAEGWPQLRKLNLDANDISWTIIYLAHNNSFPHLRELHLKSNERLGGESDLAKIYEEGNFPQLQRCDLEYSKVRDEVLAQLVEHPTFTANTDRITLYRQKTNIKLLREVAKNADWPGLWEIEFDTWDSYESGKKLADKELRVILSAKGLTGLRSLDLSYSGITTKGIASLVKSDIAQQLFNLEFTGIELDRAAIEAIANTTPLTQLQKLQFPYCKLRQSELQLIAKSQCLPALQELNMQGHSLGVDAYIHFMHNHALPQLRCLHIPYCDFSDKDKKRLLARAPKGLHLKL